MKNAIENNHLDGEFGLINKINSALKNAVDIMKRRVILTFMIFVKINLVLVVLLRIILFVFTVSSALIMVLVY